MLGHCRADTLMGTTKALSEHLWYLKIENIINVLAYPLGYGPLGVDLFFVLSGFCIHYKQAMESTPRTSFAVSRFYMRRFLRIYPTYITALLVSLGCVKLASYFSTELTSSLDTSFATFLANAFTMQGFWCGAFAGNTVLWTLSLEIHLYLAYPFLLKIFRVIGVGNSTILGFFVSYLTILLIRAFQLEHALPFWHGGGPIFLKFLFTWLVGAYIAEVIVSERSPTRPEVIFALLSLPFGLGCFLSGHKDLATPFLGVFFGTLLFFSLRTRYKWHDSPWTRCLAFVQYLGVMSYSLYIIHRPAFLLARSVIDPQSLHRRSFFPFLSCVSLTIVLAMVLFFLVERRSLKTVSNQSLIV
jgi:peptidoglycan/LPS O-acetylase OafA/YrhL